MLQLMSVWPFAPPRIKQYQNLFDSNQNGQFDSADLIVTDKISLKNKWKSKLVIGDTSASKINSRLICLFARLCSARPYCRGNGRCFDQLCSAVNCNSNPDKQQFEPIAGQSYDLTHRLEVKNNSAKPGLTTIDVDGVSMQAVLLVCIAGQYRIQVCKTSQFHELCCTNPPIINIPSKFQPIKPRLMSLSLLILKR